MITLSIMPAGGFERKTHVRSVMCCQIVIYETDVCENVVGNQHHLEMILNSVFILRIVQVMCKI